MGHRDTVLTSSDKVKSCTYIRIGENGNEQSMSNNGAVPAKVTPFIVEKSLASLKSISYRGSDSKPDSTPGTPVASKSIDSDVWSRLLLIAGANPTASVLHEVSRNHSEELAAPASVQQRSCFDICDTEGDQDVLKIILRVFFSVESLVWMVWLSPRFQCPPIRGSNSV